ncbi:hypothetical protein ACP6H1_07600 [Vibrio harveyi]|uniref:hypothetical protein n=1 Tax=Vibrio harveyi TaxID=669 RepID=UPI002A0444D2|nr:hypothetical protein [Vibrio harveyi]
MNINELRQHLDTLPVVANNRRISVQELIKENQKNGFADLDAKLFLLAKDWAIDPDLPAIAKQHKLKKDEVKELILSPLVHAAMLHCRDIYAQHSIVDAAWIRNQRVRGFHMAMGDEEIYQIDRNGMQCEGQETNLAAARGFLNDMEKADNLENGIDTRPVFNIVNSGNMSINGGSFLDQFKTPTQNEAESDFLDSGTIEGEFKEMNGEH